MPEFKFTIGTKGQPDHLELLIDADNCHDAMDLGIEQALAKGHKVLDKTGWSACTYTPPVEKPVEKKEEEKPNG